MPRSCAGSWSRLLPPLPLPLLFLLGRTSGFDAVPGSDERLWSCFGLGSLEDFAELWSCPGIGNRKYVTLTSFASCSKMASSGRTPAAVCFKLPFANSPIRTNEWRSARRTWAWLTFWKPGAGVWASNANIRLCHLFTVEYVARPIKSNARARRVRAWYNARSDESEISCFGATSFKTKDPLEASNWTSFSGFNPASSCWRDRHFDGGIYLISSDSMIVMHKSYKLWAGSKGPEISRPG